MIGFIQDQSVDLTDLYLAALEQIKETPRAADNDFRPLSERLDLGAVGDAAVNRDGSDAGSAREGSDLFVNLDRKFPGWSEDERAGPGPGVFQQALEKREPEGCRLPGSSLGESKDIAAS
tara:strand:- start:37 stop:396 length:360 start_codon:yes stop_codon:yes gene_type:complete